MCRRCHRDFIGSWRRQVVTYRTKNKRRGTENRTMWWAYISAQNANIAKIHTHTHHLSINPNLVALYFLVSNPKYRKQGRPLFQVLLNKGGTLLRGTPIKFWMFPSCTAISDYRLPVLGCWQTTLWCTCTGHSTSDLHSGVLI